MRQAAASEVELARGVEMDDGRGISGCRGLTAPAPAAPHIVLSSAENLTLAETQCKLK